MAIEKSPARHAASITKSFGQILWDLFLKGKFQYLFLWPSDYGREIVLRKYDALATDKAYENSPSGKFGFLGRGIDRMVLNFPLHADLRERLSFVTEGLLNSIKEYLNQGNKKVRILSAPCGLCRDLIQTIEALRQIDKDIDNKIELYGLDLDFTNEVIAEAKKRANEKGINITFLKEDIFNSAFLTSLKDRFHIVNCIGLTAWIELDEVRTLIKIFRDKVLESKGTLIMDNFSWHKDSKVGDDLEIYTKYHNQEEFAKALTDTGFNIKEKKVTSHNVNTVYIASTF